MSGLHRFLQALLMLIAAFGAFAGLRLTLEHLQVGEICPTLGPLPACLVVFLGYLLVLIAAIAQQKQWAQKAFYIGWSPIFILALFGSIWELVQGCLLYTSDAADE